jgi:type I restriction enzyme S subunit
MEVTSAAIERGHAGVWPTKKLGNVADFRNGLNFLRTSAGALIKIVGVSDFQRHFRISYDNLDSVRVSGALGPDDYLRNGDLLFVRSNGNKALIGRCILLENLREPISFSGFTIRARIIDPQVLPVFAGIYFQTDKARSAIHQGGEGSQISNLSQGLLGSVDIPVPPLREQHAIASALSDVDALLAGLDRLIAKKRDLKQAGMQQLLTGQTRLPGFHGDWEVRRLGDVLRFQVGFPFSSAFFSEPEQGLRLVKNRDLKTDDQIFYYTGKYDAAYLVANDDVLVGMDGDFLPCRWCKGPALLNQRVGRVMPRSGLDRSFAYYLLIEPLKKIEAATSSTTVKHLSHGDIEDIETPLPEVGEQTAIATVLYDMDAELSALEARRYKTRALKQAMMQELLTGRTRLI